MHSKKSGSSSFAGFLEEIESIPSERKFDNRSDEGKLG